MRHEPTGTYEISTAGGEPVRAFVPDPLPPEPPLEFPRARQRLLEEATLALGPGAAPPAALGAQAPTKHPSTRYNQFRVAR